MLSMLSEPINWKALPFTNSRRISLLFLRLTISLGKCAMNGKPLLSMPSHKTFLACE